MAAGQAVARQHLQLADAHLLVVNARGKVGSMRKNDFIVEFCILLIYLSIYYL